MLPPDDFRYFRKSKFTFLILVVLVLSLSQSQLAKGTDNGPAIIVVHGTYGATSSWTKIVDGKGTFASELKRGFESDCRIVPFLWDSSTKHGDRLEAARQLASKIKSLKTQHSTIHLVGHSHGGSVILKAVDLAGVDVGYVVCLATPHLFLNTQVDGKRIKIPIYATPRTKKRAKRIINLWAWDDPVATTYAGFRKGITEAEAIRETDQWRTHLNYPGLVDDGSAIREIIEDVTGKKSGANLDIAPRLKLADWNLPLASDQDGIESHYKIHSTRIGFILGQSMKTDFSPKAISYLSRTVIPANSNDGDALPLAELQAWNETEKDNQVASGWILTEIESHANEIGKDGDNHWDFDKSLPDMFFRFTNFSRSFSKVEGDQHKNKAVARWTMRTHFLKNATYRIQLFDDDAAFNDLMLEEAVDLTGKPGTSFSRPQVQLKLKWEPGHY